MLSRLQPTSIDAVKREEVVVITITGPVSASGGDLLLRAQVADAIEAGERRIALDFSAMSALDSSGLGELVRASNAAAACGGRMAWAGCPKTMLDLLEITDVRFEDVEFVDTVEAAIRFLSTS